MQFVGAGARRYRGLRLAQQALQVVDGPREAELRDSVRPAEHRVAADRLAELLGDAIDILEVVGDLVGLADQVPDPAPELRIMSRGRGARGRCRREQGTGLGSLVEPERDVRFGLPGLPCDDAVRHPGRRTDDREQRTQALRGGLHAERERLEGIDDQRIAAQDRRALAEGGMNRGAPATHRCVVEARQVVVDQ